jgi:glycosyltransferase involved in cell wall biosynthesis
MVHNRYRHAGGEDAVFEAESSLLARMGHTVALWEETNNSIEGLIGASCTALQSVYSIGHARNMRQRIRGFKPDLVHIHNFFPRMSPSIHIACRRAGVPVVQTLHNFRLLCPAATFQSPDGVLCETCTRGIVPWPAMVRGCYRGGRLASLAVANMLAIHRVLGTWNRNVSRFIALSEFARSKFVAGGIAEDQIAVKPNYVEHDPGMGSARGGFALFVGRLTEDKGVGTLLRAWQSLQSGPKLKIIGNGPLASQVARAAAAFPAIQWLGACSREQVKQAMAEAAVLILPSTWYEAFPLVIAEAFAAGLPIIASRLGTMQEVIAEGKTGRLFTPGDAADLAGTVQWIFAHPYERETMRYSARAVYKRKYNAATNYGQLMAIYQDALAAHSSSPAYCAPELQAIG